MSNLGEQRTQSTDFPKARRAFEIQVNINESRAKIVLMLQKPAIGVRDTFFKVNRGLPPHVGY